MSHPRRQAGALIALLGVLGASASAAEPPATVALDLSALDEASYARLDGLALEKSTIVRLVEEGFAVVQAGAEPDVTVRYALDGDTLTLDAGALSRTVAVAEPLDLPGLQLEIAQKTVELVRAALALAPPQSMPTTLASNLPETLPAPPPSRPPSRPPTVELGARVGALARAGGVDLALAVDARAFGLLAAVEVTPSSANGVHVLELAVVVGLDRRRALGRAAVDVGLGLGVLAHHFSVDGAGADPSGWRVDALLEAPLRLSLGHVGIAVTPGLASRGRDHTAGTTTLWARGALRLELGLDVSWRW